MNFFVLLLALLGPIEAASRPYIVSDNPGPDTCEADDPMAPCPGRKIKVRNPTTETVIVKLTCADVLSDISGVVRAGRDVIFIVSAEDVPGGLREGQCVISDVQAYKGGRS